MTLKSSLKSSPGFASEVVELGKNAHPILSCPIKTTKITAPQFSELRGRAKRLVEGARNPGAVNARREVTRVSKSRPELDGT